MSESAVPQWKKDLIARLRSQNRRTGQQLFPAPESSAVQEAVVSGRERCECEKILSLEKMVREERSSDEEDLHYGPGIVSKLKERYLSLAQRDKPRPSILRKAASLENILDDAPEQRRFQAREHKVPNRYAKRGTGELKRARSVETISIQEREGKELKRESMHEEMLIKGSMIIAEKPVENGETFAKINRPKRIQPVMSEKEKPPVDVVKQAKMIFERRPEQRTKAPTQTGEVAAKVASYKNIIVQNKPKKPTIKVKPVLDKPKTNGIRVKKTDREGSKSPDKYPTRPLTPEKKFAQELVRPKSPEKKFTQEILRPKSPEKKFVQEILRPKSPEKKFVPDQLPRSPDKKVPFDIPRPRTPEKPVYVDVRSPKSPEKKFFPELSSPKLEQLSPRRTPDLKLSPGGVPKSPEKPQSLPSPIPDISRVDFKTEENGTKSTSLTETPDLIVTSSPLPVVTSPSFRISATENFIKEEIRLSSNDRDLPSSAADSRPPPPPSTTPAAASTANSMTFNFVAAPKLHSPTLNKNVLNTQTPPSQPLKLEINGVSNDVAKKSDEKAPILLSAAKPSLTTLEIEKNQINAAKTLLEQPPKNNISVVTKCSNEVTNSLVKVPKVKRQPRELENNSIVFKFTDRKDVPDYVHNDGVKRVAKLEKPKVGEGGIILLPGASIGESFTDEDEEILRSLEGPPSPCDVTFINDNILIDGKSSLQSQKTKKAKLKISFVDEGPEVYEYPSESSLLIEDSPKSPPVAQKRHSVPSVTGGSSLGNYTPKSTEDFLPGVTRSTQPTSKSEVPSTDLILTEVEKPVLFSAGSNTDILF